jgi:hypothetical protein
MGSNVGHVVRAQCQRSWRGVNLQIGRLATRKRNHSRAAVSRIAKQDRLRVSKGDILSRGKTDFDSHRADDLVIDDRIEAVVYDCQLETG